MGNYGRLPKINFTTLLNSFIFQFSFSFFSFTSKPFFISFAKSNLNHFKFAIKTTQPNKSNARACMLKHVATL